MGFIKSKRGFTLLELLLTLLLITSSFVALSAAVSSGLFASADNESILVATRLTQEKMEELKNKRYASVAAEAKAAVTGFSAFQRDVTVSVPQSDLKQVTVTVYWTMKGDELSTNLVTYVSNI